MHSELSAVCSLGYFFFFSILQNNSSCPRMERWTKPQGRQRGEEEENGWGKPEEVRVRWQHIKLLQMSGAGERPNYAACARGDIDVCSLDCGPVRSCLGSLDKIRSQNVEAALPTVRCSVLLCKRSPRASQTIFNHCTRGLTNSSDPQLYTTAP